MRGAVGGVRPRATPRLQLGPGDVDWDRIFGTRVRWLHTGGIFAALSPTTPDLPGEAIKAAKAPAPSSATT